MEDSTRPTTAVTALPATDASEHQQRVQLAQQIALTWLALLGAVFVVVPLVAIARHAFIPNLARLAIAAALEFALGAAAYGGYWLAQRGRANAASGVLVGCTVVAVCGVALLINALTTNTPSASIIGFFALFVAIIVAGLLGTVAWTVITTFALNAFTIAAVAWLLPRLTAQPASALPGGMLVAIIGLQWFCALFVGYSQLALGRTLRALSAAQQTVAQSQQLDEMKDQFIRSVNHELRNPIMAMMNYVTILRQRHSQMAPERRTTYLQSLDETGKRVVQLVGSILDIRQIEQRPEDFVPTRVPVKATLLAASTLLDPAEASMAERDLFISLPTDLTIWGNATYLQQIFTNLLSNAVKYSPAGTAIEVRFVGQVEDRLAHGAPVEITVRDHGLGIPAGQIPLLFHRFARLQRDLLSSTSGNGLGLYLCKVLTEAMGGRIWAESSGVEGEGTTFHLVLPTQEVLPTPVTAPDPAVVMVGSWPVRRARLVLAAALALVVITGATVAVAQSATTPTPVVGELHVIDFNGGASNGLLLHLSGLPALSGSSHYQAWLIDTTTEQVLPLGDLIAQGDGYVLPPGNPPTTTNLLAFGSEIEVTRERQAATAPVGQIVFLGTYPAKAMIHVRHVLTGFPTTPGKIGLLVGMLGQMRLLDQQTQLLSAAHSDAQNQCIILSQLGVLEGKVAPRLPASCAAFAIPQGDGFGLLAPSAAKLGGYIRQASDHATLALQQPDATPDIRTHGAHVIEALATLLSEALVLDIQLRQLTSAFDASQITQVQAQVQRMVGAPVGPNGSPPPAGAAPTTSAAPPTDAYAAYGEGQRMADFTFTYHNATGR